MSSLLFTSIVFLCLGLPIASLVILLLLGFFEREFDYLQLENKQIRMEKELQSMEYLQLSQQIQPHFLFNSLNAMLSLGRLGRTKDIVESMEQFSQFLRYKYIEKDALVSFEKELEYTNHYLSVQKIRFGDKLSVEFDLDDRALPTYLPPYMLQTFVENAFKHGLEKKAGEKTLLIRLKREGSWVVLTVIDNGPETMVKTHEQKGIGLDNIRKRLRLLFDLHTDVNIRRYQDRTVVTAQWPYTPGGEHEHITGR
ncbi:histidine kinase [Bacillus sp. PK3_68]|uniref:sensor histidine kinase n=1 Tax=Bacillus sp. PK3_68 TaxID=2027408 RepID=UPI000E738CDD|nr:histidine kinase [Bacillus sp. PK3_68]RJS60334.1 sensor histidine kinase [Bacillus sp. PK3_68]